MKNQTLTQVESRRLTLEALKKAVMELLNWDEMQYCNFQYNQGLKYLDAYIQDDAFRIERSRVFWNWWKNHWALRDETILNSHLLTICVQGRREVYRDLNDGAKLASEVHPNKVVLEQSYSEMITELVKEELSNR